MLRLSDLELTPRFRLLLTALTVVLIMVITTFSLVYFFLAIQGTAMHNLHRGGKVIRVLMEERRKDLGEFARGMAESRSLPLLLDLDMPRKVGELLTEAVSQREHHLITVYDSRLEVQADVGWSGSGLTRGRRGPTAEEKALVEFSAAHGPTDTVLLISGPEDRVQPVFTSVVPVRRGERTVGYLAACYLVQEDRNFFRTMNSILAADISIQAAGFPRLMPGVHGLHFPSALEMIRFDLFGEGLVHYQTLSDAWKHVAALLILHVDGKEIRNTFAAALSFYFLFSLGMILGVMLLVTRMTGLILNPVGRLLEGVRRITSGDLQHEIPVSGKDEIAQLGHSFNEMRLSLDGKIREIHRLNDLKDLFLANTSHELRTPLVGMTGLLESVLADSQALSPDHSRKLNLVYTSSQRLSRLINDILDLSRLRKDGLPIHWTSVDLPALCRKVMGLFSSLAEGKTLELEQPEEPLPPVRADAARLEQVLINLVGNAVKFTPRGWVRIRLVPGEAGVRIEVADSGIGIPEDRQQAVFESFSQASPEISRDYGGTGLGLTISREILAAMGAELRLSSVPGKGSVFSFRLEYGEEEPESLPPPPVVLPEKPPAGLQGLRVVAVDDEVINLEVLKAQLKKTGVQLRVFLTPEEARKSLDVLPADLIIMDVMMPGKSGFDVVRQMRAEGRKEPVLFFTARNLDQDMVYCLEAGGNDIKSKPFRREELLDRISLLVKVFPGQSRIPAFLDPGVLMLLPLAAEETVQLICNLRKCGGIPTGFLDAWCAVWLPTHDLLQSIAPKPEFLMDLPETQPTHRALAELWKTAGNRHDRI